MPELVCAVCGLGETECYPNCSDTPHIIARCGSYPGPCPYAHGHHPFIEAHCTCGRSFAESLDNDCPFEPCGELEFHRHFSIPSGPGIRVFLAIEDRIKAAYAKASEPAWLHKSDTATLPDAHDPSTCANCLPVHAGGWGTFPLDAIQPDPTDRELLETLIARVDSLEAILTEALKERMQLAPPPPFEPYNPPYRTPSTWTPWISQPSFTTSKAR